MLIDYGEWAARMWVGQDHVAARFQSTDVVDHAIVIVVVQSHARRRHFLQENGLDMPVIVERFCYVQPKVGRVGPLDAAPRVHAEHVLANSHCIFHAEQLERVGIGNK